MTTLIICITIDYIANQILAGVIIKHDKISVVKTGR